MDERTGGRLELTAPRVRALLGGGAPGGGPHESTGGEGGGPPNDHDAALIADRITRQSTTGIDAEAAAAIASDLVSRARAAIQKLDGAATTAPLTDDDVCALESVLQVRGRPAVRVLGGRLESLELHPGSDLWQIFIADYEDGMIAAAAATGAVIVKSPETSQQPWLQGSAWLVARDRMVTNRHVVMPPPNKGVVLAEGNVGGWRVRPAVTVSVKFDADNRTPSTVVQRKLTGIPYVAAAGDPVDIAILAIEPMETYKPLSLSTDDASTVSDLFVVGHPGLMEQVPDAVQAVFGNPDGRKRVSFGKRMSAGGRVGVLAHDASTVGGYSGGPVVTIKGDAVAGLHYYGDPQTGNLAVTATALRGHASYAHFGATR